MHQKNVFYEKMFNQVNQQSWLRFKKTAIRSILVEIYICYQYSALISIIEHCISQRLGIYGSREKCGSFDDEHILVHRKKVVCTQDFSRKGLFFNSLLLGGEIWKLKLDSR